VVLQCARVEAGSLHLRLPDPSQGRSAEVDLSWGATNIRATYHFLGQGIEKTSKRTRIAKRYSQFFRMVPNCQGKLQKHEITHKGFRHEHMILLGLGVWEHWQGTGTDRGLTLTPLREAKSYNRGSARELETALTLPSADT
jgi:hypothetical protein